MKHGDLQHSMVAGDVMWQAVGGPVVAVGEEVFEEGVIEEWDNIKLLSVVIGLKEVLLHNRNTTTTT